MGDGQMDDEAPPSSTAIVRPLRHVRAVRERHALRFTDQAEAAASRSARAWTWALGETATAPVTDRQTPVPPSRSDIEAEIAVAVERQERCDREKRADAAAKILRWLIGDDDRVPVRVESPGELVGGFGDVVRSREEIAAILTLASGGRGQAELRGREVDADPDDRPFAKQDADYLDGVTATLGWVLGQRVQAPISSGSGLAPTTRDLKAERVLAQDVIEQARYPWMVDSLPPPCYGEGVRSSITWLLGDSTAEPVDPAGHGPHRHDGN